MGAENSVLEGCDWNAPLASSLPWEIFPVTRSDASTATVFRPKREEKKDADLLRKNIIAIRGIRHPNIIRYIGGSEARDHVWLATEQVTPIVGIIGELTADEICAGLHDVLQAIDFLHSKLGMCHNNLSLSSLFVGTDGTWKLGEMQHACKFSEATSTFLEQCRAFRSEDSLSPEEKAGSIKLDPHTGHSRDMFAFGALVGTLMEDLNQKSERLEAMEEHVALCLSTDPSLRPTAALFLSLPFMRSDLFEIIDFLRNVAMKTEGDKEKFFSNLLPRLTALPEPVLARRLVIPLLARFVLLDKCANSNVIPHVLTPRNGKVTEGLLNESLFQKYVIPQVYNIFHVHDCHIRLVLLKHFANYVHLFTRQQLDDDIFLQILLGVRDSDDSIVAASLRALADLVSIMGGDAVVGASRKSFFFHGLPKQLNPEDIAKMSAGQNVTSLLYGHKPLLKDLAAGSLSSSAKKEMSLEEKERKAREREQRREDAKLKREDRRKRLKEKQSAKEELAQMHDEKEESATMVIEEIAGLDFEEKRQWNSDMNAPDLDTNEKLIENGYLNSNNSNHYDVTNAVDKKIETSENGVEGLHDVSVEEAKLDWSDWEGLDQRSEDEQLSDGFQDISNKVQTSPSPYRQRSLSPPHPPPLTSPTSENWSHDVPEVERDISKNDPYDTANCSTSKNERSYVQSAVDSIHISKTGHMLTSNSLKLKSSTASPSDHSFSNSNSPSRHSTNVKGKLQSTDLNDLGVGLDIKSVEIKVKTAPEQDFFADMMPSIQTPSSQSHSISVFKENKTVPMEVSEDKESAILPQVNSKLFAISTGPEEDDQEISGWGDDDAIDWGGEDF